MWNGIWKLTAMVGVIGVGLFAAYQAQKGMNFPLANFLNPAKEAEQERALNGDDLQPIESLPDRAPAFDNDSKFNGTANTEPAEQDPFNDTPPKRSSKKKSATMDQDEPKVVAVSNRSRSRFIEEEESTDNSKSDAQAEAIQITEDEPPKSRSGRKSIRQVSATADEDSSAPAEPANESDTTISLPPEDNAPAATVDPFADEPKAKSADEPKAKQPAEEPKAKQPADEPSGKAQISTFDSDPPPVVSKRARQKAGKRVEPSAEDEPNPFGSNRKEPATSEEPAQATESSKTSESVPGQDAPEKVQDIKPATRKIDNSGFDRDAPPKSTPKNPPADAPGLLDDAPPVRTRPLPSRSTVVNPPADNPPSSDPFTDLPSKKRDPAPKRLEYDRVTPVDMIGDGVAGDVSQRGVQQPKITVEKVAQQQAVLEQPLVYSIIVKNVGSVEAHNLVIEDRIPKGSELVGTSPQAELSGKRLVWNHVLLKPNEEKKISIKVIPKQEGPIGSVARVYFATEVSAEIVVAAPQLEFTVKAPGEVRLGQRFDLVFNLKNVGKVEANNIIVRDLVPDELKNDAGNDIECPVGKLAPNEAREIVLSVAATKTGTVTNRATLTADAGIRKNLDSNIDVVGEVLVLTRLGKDRHYVEHSAAFTNNIRNDGNQRADRVQISEVVPAGMQFESATDGGRYDPNLKAVVWTIGPLAPGGEKTVSVKYVPKETGTHATKITAIGSAGSTAAIDASVDVVGKAELQMETVSATGSVTLGERFTSKFQLNNNGTAAATNVQLRIQLPAELKLVSVKGAKFQQDGDSVIFEPIGELAPRTKAAYELVLEPIAEADSQIGLEIVADHLTKPGRRTESIQIARDPLK